MKNIYFANHVTYSTNDPSDKKIMIVVLSQSKMVSLDIYRYLKEKKIENCGNIMAQISWDIRAKKNPRLALVLLILVKQSLQICTLHTVSFKEKETAIHKQTISG